MSRPRIPPETTAKELKASLEGALRLIERTYKGSDGRSARQRAVDMINLLQRHFDELGIDRSLTRPLADLQLSFSEAERGRLVPLFQPEVRGGQRPKELWKLYAMMEAALAMDLFMSAKMQREQAAREVVKKLKEFGLSVAAIGGKKDAQEWHTVLVWREELAKSGRKAGWHNPDWTFYGSYYLLRKEHILSQVKEGEIDPKAEAVRLLKALPSSFPTFG